MVVGTDDCAESIEGALILFSLDLVIFFSSFLVHAIQVNKAINKKDTKIFLIFTIELYRVQYL